MGRAVAEGSFQPQRQPINFLPIIVYGASHEY
jgi:hypothetical protein